MRRLGLVLSAALVAVSVPQPAQAVDQVDTTKIRNAVTVNSILAHERVLQRIANQNGGTRASGTPGYAASAKYVKDRLAAAGYAVYEQQFTFPFFRELSPATLSQTAPTPTTYETGTFEYSGSGSVTGTVVPVDLELPPGPLPTSSTSGCQPGDFPAAPAGPAVALIQRGGCDFRVKAENAAAAGYEAVIIFNEGQEGRQELFIGTLGAPQTIPTVGLSFADGSALAAQAAAAPVTVSVTTETEADLDATTTNVFADSKGGDPNKTVVVGAHLDSVVEGPGINDNGSGTSAILAIAEAAAKLKAPKQKLRFAFWGAEESGLLGSTYYVDTLPPAELAKIYANLNFDMLGSPNYVRFVYDGDGSDTPLAGPPGSAEIEDIFTEYFAGQGLASEPTEFSGRSDYGPFIEVGIPAGGLFSGAEGVKTPEQAATYGGTAGQPYDPCYHLACDTTNNLNTKALNELGDAAAHAVWTLAQTKSGLFPDGSLRTAARRGVVLEQHGHTASS